jgi:hypothetical protein
LLILLGCCAACKLFLRSINAQQQVLVVAHNAVAAQPHVKTLEHSSNDILRSLKISSLLKYPEPTMSTVKHMINIIVSG